MKRGNQGPGSLNITRKTIKLFNAVVWACQITEKTDLDVVNLCVGGFWCETRKVFLRFSSGPAIDLTTEDMDRLVAAYLRIRGIDLPRELTKRKKRPIRTGS